MTARLHPAADRPASPADRSNWLVTTDWLGAHLRDADPAIVDASLHPAPAGRDARAEFAAGHIPGAVFFDIDAIADNSSGLPHMLPDPVAFASAMRRLGIGDGMRIVV